MIEQIIYWAGVTALLTASLTVTISCIWLLFRALVKLLWGDLRKSYNLMQLNYFMREIEKKGLARCKEDFQKSISS